MKEIAIELKNVGVSYNERSNIFKKGIPYKALKGVSFKVYKGETLGIIGHNGAGKSTLLRLLAGIISPDTGEIIHHTKNVSLMALAAGFDMNLSGRKNVILSGMLMGFRKQEILNEIEKIKEFSELDDFFEKEVITYSSGMRARLGFALAMFISPDVFLIDEALGVGDIAFRQKAEAALQERVDSDTTVVIVSHSEAQVSRLAERLVWIDQGIVRREGSPKEIFPDYNLNVVFSNKKLHVNSLTVRSDFFLNFEKVELHEDTIKFNFILVSYNDEKISAVKIKYNNQTMELEGPRLSPAIQGKFPKNEHAIRSKFINGTMPIGEQVIIKAEVNEKETEILSFLVEKTN